MTGDFADVPRVLAIIVTWNKKEYVLNLLNSLKNIHYPQHRIDVVVVDNASTDATVPELKKLYPDIKLIVNPENLGGTGGFNTGLKYAFEEPRGKYDYLWLLDNDVIVHQRALFELVSLLEENDDAAVAGSTMMQLDFPYRINEVGAFFNRKNGQLQLNRHMDEIEEWKHLSIDELVSCDTSVIDFQKDEKSFCPVDYVAAASLLVRADIARQAGLWLDFFIHFDDVEWCLRISKMGKKVVVSKRSLIWHLSAAAKIPTWVLYYDNRNLLYLFEKYSESKIYFRLAFLKVLLRGLRQVLIGKPEIAGLMFNAATDFRKGRMGKKNIVIPTPSKYRKNADIEHILLTPSIKKILVPWTVNIEKTGLLVLLEKAKLKKPELQIDFLIHGRDGKTAADFSFCNIKLPDVNILRWFKFLRLRKKYDYVFQSEYSPLVGVACLGTRQIYLNDISFCIRFPMNISDTLSSVVEITKNLKYVWA